MNLMMTDSELNNLLDFENYAKELQNKFEKAENSVMKQCEKLSNMRKKAAELGRKLSSQGGADLIVKHIMEHDTK